MRPPRAATRSSIEDAELDGKHARPGPVANKLERKLMAAVREVTATAVLVDQRRGRVDVPRDAYWDQIEAIALTHLLGLEERLEDRATLYTSPLDNARDAADEEGDA